MKLTLHLFGAAKTHAETPGLVDYEDTCKLSTVGTPSGEFCWLAAGIMLCLSRGSEPFLFFGGSAVWIFAKEHQQKKSKGKGNW